MLNRPVVVALPAFFGDETPHRCVLVDIEAAGLWLSGDSINEQLGKFEETTPPDVAAAAVFFPFEQLIYFFDPAQFAPLARGARLTPDRTAPAFAPKAAPPDTPKHKSHSKQKNSKPTR